MTADKVQGIMGGISAIVGGVGVALAQVNSVGFDSVPGMIAQYGVVGVVLSMFWKYIQQSNENEKNRQKDAQTFLMALTGELKENTKATNELSNQFKLYAFEQFKTGTKPSQGAV